MRRTIAVLGALLALAAGSLHADELRLTFGRFGTVTVYRATPHPDNVVLFVSGDGGWNLGVVDMARELASLDALVVGTDIVHYLKQLEASAGPCAYPAADFEALSQFVQQKLGFPRYVTPILVGYSSGATLVYAMLVQAPPTTFAGAISLGFCPDLSLRKPLCKGRGLEWTARPKGKGINVLPSQTLEVPWIAFQGTIDQVCDPAGTESFVKQTRNAQVVVLPKVGHGYSVPRNWMPQFKRAFAQLVARPAAAAPAARPPVVPPAAAGGSVAGTIERAALADLPLVEVAPHGTPGDLMAVIVSGDGGWASIDREIGNVFAARGIPVVGLNSLQYFWKAKTPEVAGEDLARIMRHYRDAWEKTRVLLVGYSFGAEVLPFMAARLPDDLRRMVAGVALLAPGTRAQFEFHFGDWLGTSAGGVPIRPEVDKLKGLNVMCFYGEGDKDSLCPALEASAARVLPLPGGHHFGGRYEAIADSILGLAR
jgi:type IV secretory pathway VirJ component